MSDTSHPGSPRIPSVEREASEKEITQEDAAGEDTASQESTEKDAEEEENDKDAKETGTDTDGETDSDSSQKDNIESEESKSEDNSKSEETDTSEEISLTPAASDTENEDQKDTAVSETSDSSSDSLFSEEVSNLWKAYEKSPVGMINTGGNTALVSDPTSYTPERYTVSRNALVSLGQIQHVGSQEWIEATSMGQTGWILTSEVIPMDQEAVSSYKGNVIYVTADFTVLRSNPDTYSSPLLDLGYGNEGTLLGTEGRWYYVSFAGFDGYIEPSYVSLYLPGTYFVSPNTWNTVYLRSEPNVDSTITGALETSRKYEIREFHTGWGKITDGALTGWVKLTEVTPCSKDYDISSPTPTAVPAQYTTTVSYTTQTDTAVSDAGSSTQDSSDSGYTDSSYSYNNYTDNSSYSDYNYYNDYSGNNNSGSSENEGGSSGQDSQESGTNPGGNDNSGGGYEDDSGSDLSWDSDDSGSELSWEDSGSYDGGGSEETYSSSSSADSSYEESYSDLDFDGE